MPESPPNTQKPSNRTVKPTTLDKAIELVVKDDPGATKSQIANKVVGLGVTKHIESVYRRLKRSDYLQKEIHAIRDHNRQYLDRKIVPNALKVMDKAIRDKDLDVKVKQGYVKIALDKSFGEIRHSEQPSVVHIDAINNAQFVIKGDLERDN